MTFDKSQYERADTEQEQINGKPNFSEVLLTSAILRACPGIPEGITLCVTDDVAVYTSQRPKGKSGGNLRSPCCHCCCPC
jgi:hypothetical protein